MLENGPAGDAEERDVAVELDEAGQDGGVAEVDPLLVFPPERSRCADGFDLAVLDEDADTRVKDIAVEEAVGGEQDRPGGRGPRGGLTRYFIAGRILR